MSVRKAPAWWRRCRLERGNGRSPGVDLESRAQVFKLGLKFSSPVASEPPLWQTHDLFLFVMAGHMSPTDAVRLVLERVHAGKGVLEAVDQVRASLGIGGRALRSAYYHARGKGVAYHGNNILTAAKDRGLVFAAQVFIHTYFALTRPKLTELVRDLWGTQMEPTWAREWIKRYRTELSARLAKALSDKRNNSSVFESDPGMGRPARRLPQGAAPAPWVYSDPRRVPLGGGEVQDGGEADSGCGP